ncbi:uncharacterized protein BP01DRAFT_350180 [Aspergillus saccharolyticus JOP 1030-1]|uniref:Uncharacterized protein n=1 Tax=Aspergillus saccharolyticus JOP 1030-1 TaxID=1450539 RepID=A0A318Z0W7_9EURO|nr:hypothetical protein BP01DRAFT_350180 [Aspergillus saccharolyticus JOP 1030-1]PYH40941.1 hypothetical protein BP01DRAFT_350180 [Aspergillus saccharolyticus JOP 1030-1]
MSPTKKRIILEKSRTVRRRYQRSNKRLQFTASQIARIEREQERERRAQHLRDRDKKRIANKKKKAEKEARDREERRRLGLMGLPDPNAPVVPSSQPSLFSFIKKPSIGESSTELEDLDLEGWESESLTAMEDGVVDAKVQGWGRDVSLGENEESAVAAIAAAEDKPASTDDKPRWEDDQVEEDEFSDCSIFDYEDIIGKTETVATDVLNTKEARPAIEQRAISSWSASDSFQDETALLLEELGHEFDTDEEFEQALGALDAV